MILFQGFTGKVSAVEVFHPDITPQYSDYELPAGYADILGQPIASDMQKLRVITVAMSRGRQAKFVAEPEILAASLEVEKTDAETKANDADEDVVIEPEVKVIYAGASIAAVGSMTNKNYVYYQKPLTQKYVMPRVLFGLKGAVISLIAGYILILLATHQRADMARVIFEGVTLLLFVSSLVYAAYVYATASESHQNMRLYIKRIL